MPHSMDRHKVSFCCLVIHVKKFFQTISERLTLFRALLDVNGFSIQFSETDNVAACKTLHRLLLEFDEMPNDNFHSKCNRTSKKFRLEGNRLFGKKEEIDALVLYNQAICWAEHGEDLTIGFANRSAIYFRWKLYEV